MTETHQRSLFFAVMAAILIAVSLGVFAIRLIHAGPYAMPHGGAVYGAVGAILLAGILLASRPRWLCWMAIAISPVALFPALYSIMGESEEVISLYATDTNNNPVDLRLWIVDREDGAWLGMSRGKAIEHSLDGSRLAMLRHGQSVCVVPVLFDEDRDTVKAIHQMKVDKYVVARMAGSIGLYPLEATNTTVVLRLGPCPDSGRLATKPDREDLPNGY
jgi:hypothetical protein